MVQIDGRQQNDGKVVVVQVQDTISNESDESILSKTFSDSQVKKRDSGVVVSTNEVLRANSPGKKKSKELKVSTKSSKNCKGRKQEQAQQLL